MVNRKRLDPDDPDRDFGVQLRLARDARGWTQDELASRMGCSGTHISAVETGRRSPTPRFARSADRALGTGDKFSRMVQAMKEPALLDGFPEYVKYEARAVELRLYQVGIIPGLLQTPEYARILADSAVRRGAITQEQADERVSFLAERQAALVRPNPPMLFVTMDESCIWRPVGGAAVMNAQLDRLMEFAEMPNTVLQVAPYEIGERRTLDLPVNILTLPDRSVICYAESQTQGHLDRESSFVLPILTAYHQLQGASLSQTASVTKISQVRKGTK
ncbi:helix-turn-helix domain-containing protein [Streptomyces violaceoruber]|uniref:helix-turn-helix domain-containing protein n=1 Tax=Streptomyces violaceoruber TaxID=1935 RepID=UPI001F15C113|nr:helix-turn-helix transcriptional regulator [Streptomyces violaceoruber]MCF3170895.1 helix-turn-helix domain-containing protein [Streptomyces violaceoruber]